MCALCKLDSCPCSLACISVAKHAYQNLSCCLLYYCKIVFAWLSHATYCSVQLYIELSTAIQNSCVHTPYCVLVFHSEVLRMCIQSMPSSVCDCIYEDVLSWTLHSLVPGPSGLISTRVGRMAWAPLHMCNISSKTNVSVQS